MWFDVSIDGLMMVSINIFDLIVASVFVLVMAYTIADDTIAPDGRWCVIVCCTVCLMQSHTMADDKGTSHSLSVAMATS